MTAKRIKMRHMVVKTGIISFMFVFVFSSFGFAQKLKAGDYLFQLGKEYYDHGDYPQALHELSKALMADPVNEKAAVYVAKIKERLALPDKEIDEGFLLMKRQLNRKEAMNQALGELEADIAVKIKAHQENTAALRQEKGRINGSRGRLFEEVVPLTEYPLDEE